MPRIRYALRSLSKAPLLSLVVVLSLGLGIGANTAIFSVMHQMVLASLPVDKPEEIALLTTPGTPKSGSLSTDASGNAEYVFTYPAFREFEKQRQGVTGMAGFKNTGASIGYGKQAFTGAVMLVSGGYFGVLGVRPPIGRALSPADDQGSGNPVAVLSFTYWKERLGGEPVLNQPLRVNGRVFTIVGVAPKNFNGTTLGQEPSVFIPLATKSLITPDWKGATRHNDYFLYILARLKPGVTREQAATALSGTYAALVEEQVNIPNNYDQKAVERLRKSRLRLVDGSQGNSFVRKEAKTPLTILMITTGMVLLIAMANAANLLLARSAERRKELAIRAAMGAGRGEIVRQMLMEAMLLAVCGGIAGVFLASGTLRLIMSLLAGGEVPPHFLDTGIQWPVLLYALGLSLLTGVFFGLYPAWEAARNSPAGILSQESGHGSSGRGTARVRRVLVCVQVMISAVLLIPTGLFMKSLVNLMRVDVGVRTENVVTFQIAPKLNGYSAEQTRALFERAEAELAAIPGVRSVASAMIPFLGGENWMSTLTVEGFQGGRGKDTNSSLNEISPGFFGKLGVPLLMGREFTERDTLAGAKVAIVNEQFARDFFGNASPLGRKFIPGWGPKAIPNIEIVGVVKNIKYSNVKEKIPRVYYTPWRQDKGVGFMSYYLSSPLPSDQVIAQARRIVTSLDSSLPIDNLGTLKDRIEIGMRSDTVVLKLAGIFSTLATVLAMLGLYGVMAHSVTRRTREIGIRMALGAAPVRIRGMVAREIAWILGLGLVVGVPAALALSRFVESELYGVKAGDPVVAVAAVLALALAATAAGFFPARRAASVKPLDALRYE